MSDTPLTETLRLAVPLHIADIACLTVEQRMAIAGRCAGVVGEMGDLLMFASKTEKGRRRTAEAFTALARGLACAAYQPGGATFAGMHWEVP